MQPAGSQRSIDEDDQFRFGNGSLAFPALVVGTDEQMPVEFVYCFYLFLLVYFVTM